MTDIDAVLDRIDEEIDKFKRAEDSDVRYGLELAYNIIIEMENGDEKHL